MKYEGAMSYQKSASLPESLRNKSTEQSSFSEANNGLAGQDFHGTGKLITLI
jgi:hypothetical protein